MKLIGTMTGAYPYAVILAPGRREQELYMLGDDVGGGWIIDAVGVNRIVLRNGDQKEVVEVKFIEADAPKRETVAVPSATSAGMTLDSRDAEAALSDLNKVMTQARVAPYTVDGKISGYTIFEIVPGSLYSKLGLQNSDVVERVNGIEIKSPDTLYQLFQQIKHQRRIALDFIRGGKRESVNIEIR